MSTFEVLYFAKILWVTFRWELLQEWFSHSLLFFSYYSFVWWNLWHLYFSVMTENAFRARDIGLRAQKKILSRMATKTVAKTFIDGTTASLLDNIYRLAKLHVRIIIQFWLFLFMKTSFFIISFFRAFRLRTKRKPSDWWRISLKLSLKLAFCIVTINLMPMNWKWLNVSETNFR